MALWCRFNIPASYCMLGLNRIWVSMFRNGLAWAINKKNTGGATRRASVATKKMAASADFDSKKLCLFCRSAIWFLALKSNIPKNSSQNDSFYSDERQKWRSLNTSVQSDLSWYFGVKPRKRTDPQPAKTYLLPCSQRFSGGKKTPWSMNNPVCCRHAHFDSKLENN